MSHDLSYKVVKLDYDKLKAAVSIAVRRSLWDAEVAIDKVHSLQLDGVSSDKLYASRDLFDASRDLYEAMDSLYALTEGESRNKIIIDGMLNKESNEKLMKAFKEISESDKEEV
jgi:hypothetical protein